jgi:hypothetical protein
MPKSRYELNGAGALSAALWFLCRERERHFADIDRINRDIDALEFAGVQMPEAPELSAFFVVPGGNDRDT